MPNSLTCNSARPNRRTSRTAFTDLPPAPDDPLLGFAPYVHAAPRRNSITPDRQRAFIAELAACGIVTQAARAIGASLEALYRLRLMPGAEGFAAAWELAIDRGIARLEDCALERAIQGEERPIVSAGKLLGTWLYHDNKLLMFLLRQRRAERYGADVVPVSSLKPGHPVYEQLKQEWRGDQRSEQEIHESIDRMIDEMIERGRANQAIIDGEFDDLDDDDLDDEDDRED